MHSVLLCYAGFEVYVCRLDFTVCIVCCYAMQGIKSLLVG
jgi:hypothetical protein